MLLRFSSSSFPAFVVLRCALSVSPYLRAINPVKLAVADVALSDLTRIARWQTIRSIENDDLDSEIMGNVRVGIRRYVKGQGGAKATAEELPADSKDADGGYIFLYDPGKNLGYRSSLTSTTRRAGPSTRTSSL